MPLERVHVVDQPVEQPRVLFEQRAHQARTFSCVIPAKAGIHTFASVLRRIGSLRDPMRPRFRGDAIFVTYAVIRKSPRTACRIWAGAARASGRNGAGCWSGA